MCHSTRPCNAIYKVTFCCKSEIEMIFPIETVPEFNVTVIDFVTLQCCSDFKTDSLVSNFDYSKDIRYNKANFTKFKQNLLLLFTIILNKNPPLDQGWSTRAEI